jgi:hypothetical protein
MVDAKAPKDPEKYYGAPMLPTVRGRLVECDTREEHLAGRDAYEEAEANCNTCLHLKRIPQQKDPMGFLFAKCMLDGGEGRVLRFHPEDPMHKTCWVTRRMKEV